MNTQKMHIAQSDLLIKYQGFKFPGEIRSPSQISIIKPAGAYLSVFEGRYRPSTDTVLFYLVRVSHRGTDTDKLLFVGIWIKYKSNMPVL